MLTVNCWLGGLRVESGVYGPKKRMDPMIEDGGAQAEVGHDWNPITTDTSCEKD